MLQRQIETTDKEIDRLVYDKGYATASFVFLVINMILLTAVAVFSWSVGQYLMPKFLSFREEMGVESGALHWFFCRFGIWWLVMVLVTGLLLVWKKRWLGAKRAKADLSINIGVSVALVAYIVFYSFVNLLLIYDTVIHVGLRP
jgi:hypothetical protein